MATTNRRTVTPGACTACVKLNIAVSSSQSYRHVVLSVLSARRSKFISSRMADSAIAALQATALTARCHNSFFRQKQLKALHDALRQDSNTIKDAIKSDTRVSEPEATTEVALALDLVKEHYSSINHAKELEEEYQIANGKNASNHTEPWGVVYIEPQQSHTPFYSVIAALSAALAAGNCVALKVSLFP